jgi:hypothetical protein
MIKVSQKYLTVNPNKTSGAVVDLHRIWAERVPVRVVKVHMFRIRNRYEVEDADGRKWSTGRLLRIKKAGW